MDTKQVLEEIKYCMDRLVGVMEQLQFGKQNQNAWNSFASSIAYLASSNALLCKQHKELEPILDSVNNSAVQVNRIWFIHECDKPSPTISLAEGCAAIEKLGFDPTAEMLRLVKEIPHVMPPNKVRHGTVNEWRDLTQMITLQRLIHYDPLDLIRYVMRSVINRMPLNIAMRAKTTHPYTVTQYTEDRIYTVTHIVLALSEYGAINIPMYVETGSLLFLMTYLEGWIKEFIKPEWWRQRIHNRELLLEVACSILILSWCHVPERKETEDALTFLFREITECAASRSKIKELLNASPSSRSNVYVVEISNDQPRGEWGGLYVNFHTHYLVALFYMLYLTKRKY